MPFSAVEYFQLTVKFSPDVTFAGADTWIDAADLLKMEESQGEESVAILRSPQRTTMIRTMNPAMASTLESKLGFGSSRTVVLVCVAVVCVKSFSSVMGNIFTYMCVFVKCS